MEEEVGIKVTRLRRRLSVEADDVKSPSTQSTPTKKRGGRLAAKPQLELIDENASEAAPKRTRKSIVKEAEPVEEKAVTPSRRSTRIRSNTSIVSEAPDVAEDKGTPSRRSTRIKSNTSLVAEPVNVNSPRAKRAARRTSQVGSDNEAPAPTTPARATRRTRNNSTSSIDKPVETTGKLGAEIKKVIAEESEINGKESKSTESSQNDSPSLRKSSRFNGKSGNTSSLDNDNKENEPQSGKEPSETSAAADKSLSEPKAEQTIDVTYNKAPEQINLSVGSKNLIQELEAAPKKGKSTFNKSTTAIEEPQIKTKRNRTKSWTTISIESPQESNFCSDSETTKKRNKKKNDILNFSNISGSGDGIMNTSNKTEEIEKEQDNVSLNSSTLSNKIKKKRHEMSMTAEIETSVHEVSVFNTSVNKSAAKLSEVKKEDVNEELNLSKKLDTSGTQTLFDQAPTGVVQSLVFIEDSDSNNEKGFDSGDQCVPVADHQTIEEESSKNSQINLSYEPMDIDETMPENISLSNFVDKNDSTSEKRKSILNISQVKNDSFNKSKRKSVISNMVSEDKIDEGSTKSPRKSSISEMVINDDGDNNKSKRKSSINNQIIEDTTDGTLNESSRKSLVIDMDSGVIDMDSHDESINKKANKSKRNSSISNYITEKNTDDDSNNSTRKSLNADKSNDESLNKEANKSKRNSSLSNIGSDDISNKSSRKSSVTELAIDEIMDKSLNKSKRKSLLSNTVSDEMTNNISNKSSRKSTLTELAIDENMDKSLNKSKRKSLTAMAVEVTMNNIKSSILDGDVDMANNSSNISKRKSSILNSDSMDKSSDKTENNENKSTLVLSQLKDVSENEINTESSVTKDSSDSNEQLSKSVNVPNIATEKDTDKKNLSLTYSTSTPLQQKSMKKLALQINSSIIAPNSANKVDQKNTSNKSKKEASIMSEEDGSDTSEEEEDDVEEESEEESSDKKSQIIDDEAEEASDDYESGDSRDEDEKEYEEQNEIREKGETLDSDEEDLSDDSDYEKDSFIVSSDAADQDLLSGSADDLSMSADELTMSAKSKNNFNERKIKEQKKASREMYEARHKLNLSDKSDKSPKSKKNNRQRFDTSSSESEEEVVAQPRKNRRQRIDSSHDASGLKSDTDKSLSKKKKAKRLSESVCDEDETNEKEITIRHENPTEKDDPLTLLNVIKEEPKTPQKSLNISTVAVTDMDEEVDDEEEDVEEVDVEGVDEEENASIMKSNQISDPLQATMAENDEEDDTDESSISENEEITQNYESVLSNLNKSGSKKIKASNISLELDKKTKQKAKEPIVDQLNLTQVKTSKKKKGDTAETTESKKQNKSLNKSIDRVAKKGITLSEGSSDSIDMKLLFTEDSNDSEIVIGHKEKAVKETAQNEDDEETPGEFIPLKRSQGKTNILENMAPPEFDQFGYFIDTTGALSDDDKHDADTSIKGSAKKNKQKNNVSFVDREEIPVDEDSNDAPLEVSYRSEKNKSKQDLNTTQNNKTVPDDNVAVGTPNESAKKKKKNKKGLNSSQNEISVIETTDDVPDKSVNMSVTNVEGSAKKKKKRLSESQTAPETETPAQATLNISLGSAKKQKKKTISESTATDTLTEPTLNVSSGSAKKQKHRTISESAAMNTHAEPTLNVSLGSAKNQKQKTTSESAAAETENVNKENEEVINQELATKKRKRKQSANETIDEIIIKDDIKVTNIEPIPTKNQKKKRKISNNDEDNKLQVEDLVPETQKTKNTPAENTKKKNKLQHQKDDEIGDGATNKNKKRKERDDDDASEISKVLKQNSFDKVHVTRLPSNVLKQLDDKPKNDVAEAKKTKIVSTSEFIVEETKRRRNKPSNYLEESIYCTNDDMDEKKQKRSIKTPKVLPFIPTASTSDSGFTTNFRVNVISQPTKFVAQSSDVSNFKNDYLQKKRIKKLGTFEMYKRQRNIKIAKF